MPKPGFRLHHFVDETSQFDPKGRSTTYGYERDYWGWIPENLTDRDEIDQYISDHLEDDDFWAGPPKRNLA